MENAAQVRGVFVSTEVPAELLRHRLLECAVDLLIGRITASLTRLRGLQSLVGGALSAVSRRLCGLSGAGSSISSSLRCGCILHSLLGSCLDPVDVFLRNAAACSNENEGSDTCLQRGEMTFFMISFPFNTGSDKLGPERKIPALNPRALWLVPRISPRIPFICKRCVGRTERAEGYRNDSSGKRLCREVLATSDNRTTHDRPCASASMQLW